MAGRKGVYVLGGAANSGSAQIGILFMVLAAIGWGVYSMAGQRVADPLQATARNFLWSVPLVALTLYDAPLQAQPPGLVLAMLSGALTSALGYALWYSLLPALGASRAAVAQLSVPILALFAGAALLREPLTASLILGAAVVLAGVTLGLRPGPRR